MAELVELTEEMKLQIKKSVAVEGCDFKYSAYFDTKKMSSYHAVMIKGEVTLGEWVICGSTDTGIFEFESEAQAKLFISELKKEFESRKVEA